MRTLPPRGGITILTRSRTTVGSRRRILELLLARDALSRAELARLSHLNKPTVSNLVAGLIDEGIVQEIGSGTSTGGRKPILLSVRGSGRLVVGLEIDASSCRLLLVTLHGERLSMVELPLERSEVATVVEVVAAGVNSLLTNRDRSTLLGCGVAVPGLVDPANDTVDSARRLGWEGTPLRSLLAARLGVPVMVTDRGKAAALGELWVLGKERAHDLIYLYLGRGVAGAIVLGREIHWGASNIAGEIGHMTVDPDGPVCACGNRGCLEAFVSTAAIIEQLQPVLATKRDGPLARALRSDAHDSDVIAAIGEAATLGDPDAGAVVSSTARWLAIAIAGLINVLNPSVVVLGGPTAGWGRVLTDAIDHELGQRALPLSRREVTIVIGHARDLAAPLGGAALVLQRAAGLLAGSEPNDGGRRSVA
ncbi:MAG: hypothetical protein AVDCRST_MAG73-3372 [uncultured Thermomicrobiales bacterium]|uniref:HTH iclR-type domain-containing protein n=1 Tax=uncultured Thermomicrobiales bacterium TaxID=1645740 RepID=A0A6J4URM7_9BACT|nr:MAG: hypothetical protein AVDCRST_MAG73-3372 [uncultured Thermomicrobiales bacterium]